MKFRILLPLVAVALVGCGRDDAPDQQAATEGGAGTAALSVPAPGSGAVHVVRLLARGDQYAFEPAEVRIRVGDVVRFVHTDHQPETVAFDSAAAPPAGAESLSRQDLLRGPLLTEPGAFFDVPFIDVPPGEYPFHSLPHAQRGMRGRVVVEE